MLLKLKRLLSLGILLCFFLPLAQCTLKPDAHAGHSVAAQASPEKKANQIVFVPVQALQSKEWYVQLNKNWHGFQLFVLFLWPLSAFMRKSLQERHIVAVNLTHTVLCLISLSWLLDLLSFYTEIRYGGIMLFTFLPAYLLCSLIMLGRHFIAKAGKTRPLTAPGA